MKAGQPAESAERRRVVIATGIGTAIEWYDFFLYAQCAAIVFGPLYFHQFGARSSLLLSLGTIGISFLFRPLGAVIAGNFGDKIGRRRMLVATLFMMGGATALVGLVPTSDQIGFAAPLMLMLLRIIQGLSAGGEWGGAALMAVESAPRGRRGRFGAAPQLGAPLGLLLATGFLALMAAITRTEDEFLAWGWRVPFLFSAVLIYVGYEVRRRVEESPVFVEMSSEGATRRLPIVQLFRKNALLVIVAALVYAGNSGASYIVAGGFLEHYVTSPDRPSPLTRGTVLTIITVSGFLWVVAVYASAALSDRIGRRNTYLIGWVLTLLTTFPLLLAMQSGNVWLLFLGITAYVGANMFTYGPMAAYFAELFPASVRYSGIAIAYAIGSIIGGAFAPTISVALVAATGSLYAVGLYVGGLTLVSLAATLVLRDRTDVDLGPDSPDYARSPFYGARPAIEVPGTQNGTHA
ncbi:Fosfomycin resistance protein AbaF [Paraburkholderia hiiakae]|uniref:Fosfomycin resistance protein AbaF n=1 Tax=Paraburkholderia hiiakae TaxID=1081782 RepID=A0ABM8NZJ4_9BURK|nr:MFS transporter [Paraburkholderia hiiakae]CAD6550717.1 Fosfomycin resistance protein AbaF [Paraburkholderia hiiakae]